MSTPREGRARKSDKSWLLRESNGEEELPESEAIFEQLKRNLLYLALPSSLAFCELHLAEALTFWIIPFTRIESMTTVDARSDD